MNRSIWKIQRLLARFCLWSGGLGFLLILLRHPDGEAVRMGTALLGLLVGYALLGNADVTERVQRLESELALLRRER